MANLKEGKKEKIVKEFLHIIIDSFFACEHDSSEPMSNIECERLYCIKKNTKKFKKHPVKQVRFPFVI